MKRVATNTAILLGVNFSGAVIGFLMSVLIGRALGSVGLGRYAFVMAWIFALGIFAEFGLNTLITRDIARNHADADRYLFAVTCARIGLALALIVALGVIAQFITHDAETITALRLGAPLILLNAIYGSFTAIFRAFERMFPILILNSGGLVFQLIGTIFLIANGFGVVALVAIALIVQLIQCLAAFWLYRNFFGNTREQARLDIPLTLNLLRAALPFAAAGIISAIELRANIAMLGIIQGDQAVGWYSAATRFTEGAKLLPNAFFGAIFPAFAAASAIVGNVDAEACQGGSRAPRGRSRKRAQGAMLHEPSDNLIADDFQKVRRRFIWFAVVMVIGLSAFAHVLINTTYGTGFESAEPVLTILSVALIPSLVNGLSIVYLFSTGAERFVNQRLAISLLIQLLVAIPLIHSFSAIGAALSALIGDLILLMLLELKWKTGQIAIKHLATFYRALIGETR